MLFHLVLEEVRALDAVKVGDLLHTIYNGIGILLDVFKSRMSSTPHLVAPCSKLQVQLAIVNAQQIVSKP